MIIVERNGEKAPNKRDPIKTRLMVDTHCHSIKKLLAIASSAEQNYSIRFSTRQSGVNKASA